jgi:hypothetical protein
MYYARCKNRTYVEKKKLMCTFKSYRVVPGRSKSTSRSPTTDACKGLPCTWIPGTPPSSWPLSWATNTKPLMALLHASSALGVTSYKRLLISKK